MKILELTNYSSGGCGVFARVREESIRLAEKGHQVKIFSSNRVKNSPEIASPRDSIGKVEVHRFKAKKLGGESYMTWGGKFLIREIYSFKPDVIIAHGYRHPHTVVASRMAKKIGAKSILVTHAPFDSPGSERSLIAKLYISLYHDPFIGRPSLKRFDKIVAISKWEIPYLLRLGVPEKKITLVPNGIPESFFNDKEAKEDHNKILYFGRVAPVKDLETLIVAFSKMKNKEAFLEIAGPGEPKYFAKLKSLIKEHNVQKRVFFSPAIYNIKEKIKKIDSANIFVLPSKREGMPQALIEALARQKIVIGSDNIGNKELIQNRKNGFIFPIGNPIFLASLLDSSISLSKREGDKIRQNARESVRQFSWNEIIRKIEKMLNP